MCVCCNLKVLQDKHAAGAQNCVRKITFICLHKIDLRSREFHGLRALPLKDTVHENPVLSIAHEEEIRVIEENL